jgi:hypothetical protein
MDRVKSGQKKITAKQWPSMFYDMSLYNPKNKKAGFLRGHAIVQVRISLTIVVSHIGLELLGMAPYLHWTDVGAFKRSDSSLFKAD